MSYSLDVNILLYASDTSSRLHTAASGFLQSCMEGGDLFYVAWPTVMGYLRIATHPSFDEPLMANVQTLLDLPHAGVWPKRTASGRHGANWLARRRFAATSCRCAPRCVAASAWRRYAVHA